MVRLTRMNGTINYKSMVDRICTYACHHVTVSCILPLSEIGSPAHRPQLESLKLQILKLIDNEYEP